MVVEKPEWHVVNVKFGGAMAWATPAPTARLLMLMYLSHPEELSKDLFKDSISNIYKV